MSNLPIIFTVKLNADGNMYSIVTKDRRGSKLNRINLSKSDIFHVMAHNTEILNNIDDGYVVLFEVE